MKHCVLKSKISISGMSIEGREYYHIKLDNNAKSFTINNISRTDANKIIDKNDLKMLFKDHNGEIFCESDFKEIINSNPRTKKKLLESLSVIESQQIYG